MNKKIKKSGYKIKSVCLVLCLLLVFGSTITSYASSGNITYGGASISWSMSSSKYYSKFSYKSSANLAVKGKVYVKNKISGIGSYFSISDSKKSNVLITNPSIGLFNQYTNASGNYSAEYINGNQVASFIPRP